MRYAASVLAVAFAAQGVTSAATMPQNIDLTDSFSRAYQACITYGETHNTTAIPAAECNARELRFQDGLLNKTYKKVMDRLSAPRKADLRADERNWMLARDQKCSRMPDVDLRVECRIGETIRRISYLQRVR